MRGLREGMAIFGTLWIIHVLEAFQDRPILTVGRAKVKDLWKKLKTAASKVVSKLKQAKQYLFGSLVLQL